ncbi:NUDIX domain-containing protein [Mucilaginibacter segetis]|nr:NUDIX domain-containing protein [Mucilaginibacter segetis]
MPKQSAGILVYRTLNNLVQVFLVHPGGPFFRNKDNGNWSVPKGEYDTSEDPLKAAQREFEEETGQTIDGDFITLQPIKYKSGKIVNAWAVEGKPEPGLVKSNFFEMEWPPRSGKMASFPEVDRAEWFDLKMARQKILPAQIPFIDELEQLLSAS